MLDACAKITLNDDVSYGDDADEWATTIISLSLR